MEQLLQEIVTSTNGKYSLSNILDMLDSLRRQKRIDMPMFEQIYKRIINESRTNGDKWFEKYMTTTSLNFSFDLKRSFGNEENQPNLINKLLSDNRSTNTLKTETCKPFTSPSNMGSPPTYETKCSRMTDYQSDHQKQLTNQILKQMQSSDRRRISEHNKSIQVSFHQQNYTEGIDKLKQFVQRKILQQERQALNKIIYVINEPVKVTKFTIKNPQLLEKNVNDLIEQREIKIKFNYFDCLKQYWIRRRFLKNTAINILASRKTNYIEKAFGKLNQYAKKHKHQKNHLSQAIYSFEYKINRKYFDQWKLFINQKRTKHSTSTIIIGFKKMNNKIQTQKCFKFLKQYTNFKRENTKQLLFAQTYHESLLKHKVIKLWGQLAESSQVLQMNEFVQQKFFRAWKCVTIQRQYKSIQKQVAIKKYKQAKQSQILKIFKEFINIIQTKNILHKQMRQLQCVKNMKKVIQILSENVIKQQMKKHQLSLINQFLYTKYISKPFIEIKSYTRQQSIKKELYKRIEAIRIKNLLYKLIQNWGMQVQVKKHHYLTEQTALPKLKQFQLYLYFKRYRISFKQSLHLKKLNKIMKFKRMKEFLKEIKLITVKFKQEFKYPLKLKKQVFAAFKHILNKKCKKSQFHDQLHTLHEMNMQRSIFEFMRRRGAIFRKKKQLMRSVKNFQFGKYIAGPFYFLLKYAQNHLARKHLKNNFTKLYIVKTFQKSFNQLSKYSWKRRMQTLKDQQNIPKIIASRKIKILRKWNAKCHSAKKIDAFCYNFEKMQVRIFFKHMQLIKITDYQKKKYMIQGRLYYLMKFTFKKLKQYHNRQKTCRQHEETIKRRQIHRYQKSTFNHIRRLYTFEHNIAYLTAYTILHIKKQILQKYFKGFQHILLNKKRPRDQIMKLNKKRKWFKGWIKYTNKNKAIKYFMASMHDIKMNYSLEFLQQLEQIKQDQYANEQATQFHTINLKIKTFKQWHKIIETSQKYQYLIKLLNKQLIKQYQIGLDTIQQENAYQYQKQLEDIRLQQQLKQQVLMNLIDLINQNQQTTLTGILNTFQLNSKFTQIKASRHIKQKQIMFKHWKNMKMLKQNLNLLHQLSSKHQVKSALHILSIHNKQEKIRNSNRRFILKKKLQTWRRKYLQLQKLNQLESLIQQWDIKSQQSAMKQILNNHTILKFRDYQNQKITYQIFSLLVQEYKLKQRAIGFAEKLKNIFSGRVYFKECGSFFFYQLKDYQIQQLKGEVVLRTFDKLIYQKKKYILGRLAQNVQFSEFTQRRQWIKQIKCFAEWAKFTNQQIALKYIGKTIQKVQPQDFGKILKLSKEGIQNTLFPDQIEKDNFLQLNKDSNQKLLHHSNYMLLQNYKINQLKCKFFKIWLKHLRFTQALNILTQVIDEHENQKQIQIYYKSQFMNILKQDKNTQETLINFHSIIKKKYTDIMKKTFETTRIYGKSNQIKKHKKKQSFKQWHNLSKFNIGIEKLTNALSIIVKDNLNQHLNQMAYQSKQVYLNKRQIIRMKQKYLKYWQKRFKQKDVALVFIPILQQMINQRRSAYLQQFQVELQCNRKAESDFQHLVIRNVSKKIVSEMNKIASLKAKQNSQLIKLRKKQGQQILFNCFVEWNTLFNLSQKKKIALNQISNIILRVQRQSRGQEMLKALKLEKKLQVKQEIELNQSLLYSVFISWRMQTNENKMLKKYLHECQVEERRSHSFPKY